MTTRQKAQLEWSRSEKTGYDLHRLILINSNTVDDDGNLLGKVSAAGTTSVDVTKATPDLVEDNEELFQISTDTLPESANNHLKIKLNKGTFLNRRRG